MTFQINNFNYNVHDLVRKLGYQPLGYTAQGELNCARRLGGDYPRFHVYLTETPRIVTFHIHLDQKKPSYEGATAHSGDYDSDTIKEEVERIKAIIFGTSTDV